MNRLQDATGYAHFASRVRSVGLISDPWCNGQPRFATQPHLLSTIDFQAITLAAECMTAIHDEMVQKVMQDPRLFKTYFHLGQVGQSLWECSAPRWHGLARADMFLTQSGPIFCELNSDTPSGHAETTTLSKVFAEQPGRDPNTELETRFCSLVGYAAHQLGKPLTETSVGLLYPTEFTEDLGLVLLYERWLASRGAKVVLGSPFNLQPAADGRVALLGTPCDIFLRHYKTDWWVEREPVWRSEAPFPDDQPLFQPLAWLLKAELDGKITVLNPFGSILPQNKRSLALLWEEQARFSVESQAGIARFLPPTFRLETQPYEVLRREREEWVLKSDYGCEGEETLVGRATTPSVWEAALEDAVPGRWIAQRCFEPLRDESGCECNLGVYLVAGSACGIYARKSIGPTDVTALSTAVRVAENVS